MAPHKMWLQINLYVRLVFRPKLDQTGSIYRKPLNIQAAVKKSPEKLGIQPFFWLIYIPIGIIFQKIGFSPFFLTQNLNSALLIFSTRTAYAKNSIFVLILSRCNYLQLLKKLALQDNLFSRKNRFSNVRGQNDPLPLVALGISMLIKN